LPPRLSDTTPQRLSTLPLRAPVNVTWEITEACNLDCAHCLSAELRAEQRGELDLEQCRVLLDELARMQVFQVNFGGGEPFLRPDFLDILRYAHRLGITTCVSTNGTVLDDALIDELLAVGADAPAAPVYLQVSLDGAKPETNDAIRGAGTFGRILAGIELLLKIVPADNILFGSEMVGAVRSIDPETGQYFDDTKRYIDQIRFVSDADKRKIFEGNARKVYSRLKAKLPASK